VSKPSAAERQYLREHAATLLGPRMSVVTRDDLMAFLKAKMIGPHSDRSGGLLQRHSSRN
jgi:hypothetical protein